MTGPGNTILVDRLCWHLSTCTDVRDDRSWQPHSCRSVTLASVNLPTLLDRSFRPGTAFRVIAPTPVSNSWRRWSRNGRNTECRQCISGVSASTLFLVVCLPLRLGPRPLSQKSWPSLPSSCRPHCTMHLHFVYC